MYAKEANKARKTNINLGKKWKFNSVNGIQEFKACRLKSIESKIITNLKLENK